MRLSIEQRTQYGSEIAGLYQTHLAESPTGGLTHFGTFDRDNLMAVGAVKCYMGNWYLRAFVVKPEFRGRGLQRKLMRECLRYLSEETDANLARISVEPDNIHSIRNIEAVGFKFETMKKLKDGKIVRVYKKKLSRNS